MNPVQKTLIIMMIISLSMILIGKVISDLLSWRNRVTFRAMIVASAAVFEYNIACVFSDCYQYRVNYERDLLTYDEFFGKFTNHTPKDVFVNKNTYARLEGYVLKYTAMTNGEIELEQQRLENETNNTIAKMKESIMGEVV